MARVVGDIMIVHVEKSAAPIRRKACALSMQPAQRQFQGAAGLLGFEAP